MRVASDRSSNRIAGLAFAVGAIGYALAVGAGGLTFNVTPLWFGITALVAGLTSRQARLVSIALVLIGWGAAVLLVREGPIPHNREAAAELVGAGAGMLAASIWARRHHISTIGAATTLLSGGLAFFLAYDIDALGRWPAWTALMVVWAAFETVRTAEPASSRRP